MIADQHYFYSKYEIQNLFSKHIDSTKQLINNFSQYLLIHFLFKYTTTHKT